jgi:hypothetical protein
MIGAVLLVIVMFCLDVCILAIGSGLNERACRDAARMAAQSPNYAGSLVLAQTAVKAYTGDGYFVTTPTVDPTKFVYNDFSGNPPSDTSPYVTVTTSCKVLIPAPIFVYGLNFSNGSTMTFTKTYTFPIVTTTYYAPSS